MSVPDPRFCPACGADLAERHVEGRDRKFCPDCERPVYRNPKPCAGVLVVDGERLLLVKRTEPPAVGAWSVPAGYLEADEPPEIAAVRELREETSLAVDRDALRLHGTSFVERADGWHVLVVLYTAPRSATSGEPTPGSDAGAARFWDLDALLDGDERIEPGYRSIFRRAIEGDSDAAGRHRR